MNFLIDTNIFIPLESHNTDNREAEREAIAGLYRDLKKLNHHIFLLDTQKKDLENDKNEARKQSHLLSFEKYELLENVQMADAVKQICEQGIGNAHDYIDLTLLNAVYVNAVSILITNDAGIHKKAIKLEIEDRVYSLEDALDFVHGQQPKELTVLQEHPVIKKDKCYNIDIRDSFFDSLRADYIGFDNWFRKKCQESHRDCLTIRENGKLIGICIYKFEDDCYAMSGTILKICTFKLKHPGNKLGELLLKNIFNYSYQSNVDWIYVTSFEKNYICQFFEKFGFEQFTNRKEDTGELIYRKQLIPNKDDDKIYSPIKYHIKFGPHYFDETVQSFLVPIKPFYFESLFPETIDINGHLFPDFYYSNAFSNSIQKAYICKSRISKLKPGSIIFFYITEKKLVQACGIVEKTYFSSDPNEIISLTGKRTVYTYDEIANQCKENTRLLIVLFRQTDSLFKNLSFDIMRESKLVKGYPQSITSLSEGTKQWILQHRTF